MDKFSSVLNTSLEQKLALKTCARLGAAGLGKSLT